TVATGDTLLVLGNLLLTDGVLNSTGTAAAIEARGDVTVAATWDAGTEPMLFTGSAASGKANQLFTPNATLGCSITINKAAADTVTLGNNLNVQTALGAWTLTLT